MRREGRALARPRGHAGAARLTRIQPVPLLAERSLHEVLLVRWQTLSPGRPSLAVRHLVVQITRGSPLLLPQLLEKYRSESRKWMITT